MAGTTIPGMFLTGNHAGLPTASTVAKGTIYSCTTHGLLYQTTDGATWATWHDGTAAGGTTYQPLDSDLTAFAGLAIAADKLPYGTGSHTLGLADFTAAGRAIVDDADAAAQRTTLGLGTMAVEAKTITTKGDVLVGGAAGALARLAVGTDGYVLTADAASTPGVKWAAASAGFSDPMTTRGDVIVRNASNVTARLAKGSAGTYLGSDGTDVAYTAVTDAQLSTSDITTNNVSTSKHGFAPKLPNDATKYLDGTGAYSSPAGGGATIQYPALKPVTPTDDFAAASLNVAWSAHSSQGSFATTDCHTQAVDGSHLHIGYSAKMGALYRSVSNVDQEWSVGGMRMHGEVTGAVSVMAGIAVLNTSGTGVGLVSYNDGNIYLSNITGWAYASLIASASLGHNLYPASPVWLRLVRATNTWSAYASMSGSGWDTNFGGTTGSVTITAAYQVFGLLYNTSTAYKGALEAEWVHSTV